MDAWGEPLREVKGHFREWRGKRIWIPDHEDSRQAATPESAKAPKSLKPVSMPPPQPLKDVSAPKGKQGAAWMDYAMPKSQPKVYQGEKPSGGFPWAKSEPSTWTAPPKKVYTKEEQLAYLLKHNPKAILHPKKDEHGEDFYIKNPSAATGADTWADKTALMTILPGGNHPKKLNGVALKPWLDHPTTEEGWVTVEGQDADILEPEWTGKMAPAAGVVIEEPDGRIWVVHPTNGFAGYKGTFPKGHQDNPQNLQATAIREAFEESGMKVEITGFLGDVDRSATTTRYYTAKRVGGDPTDCGWETQAVSLVPRTLLYHVLNNSNDHGLAEMLGAGPQPPKPKWESPKWDKEKWDSFGLSKPSKHPKPVDPDDTGLWDDPPF